MADTLKIEFLSPSQRLGQELGIMILQAIQEVLTGPRSGRWYPAPGNPAYDRSASSDARAKNYYVKFTGARTKAEIEGAAYRASAPGEPPASRTGRLRQSFYVRIDGGEDEYKVTVKTNVIYADDLEYGTERMEPRPFLDTAIKKVLPQIAEKIGTFVYKTIRGEAE